MPLRQQGDVRKSADSERWVRETVAKFGRLDILVNCAAGNFLVRHSLGIRMLLCEPIWAGLQALEGPVACSGAVILACWCAHVLVCLEHKKCRQDRLFCFLPWAGVSGGAEREWLPDCDGNRHGRYLRHVTRGIP
jgi:hypothetical protein